MNFTEPIPPFLKWPGGKSSELNKISSHAPEEFARYIDPFVGGGSVLFSVNPSIPAAINDICPELTHLYAICKNEDREFELVAGALDLAWTSLSSLEPALSDASGCFIDEFSVPNIELDKLINQAVANVVPYLAAEDLASFKSILNKDLPTKFERMSKIQSEKGLQLSFEDVKANIEGSIKAGLYMMVRFRYNTARARDIHSVQRDCDFFFLREFAYASMFRFNAKGEFNVPYGGVSYNRKSFGNKVDRLYANELRTRLKKTEVYNLDWKHFLGAVSPTSEDFVFVDPPYDSDFSDYDNKTFDSRNQEELATYLENLTAKVMIVIGDTPLIRDLYGGGPWSILEDEVSYKWTIKSRNERRKKHLTLRNYS